MLELTEMLKTLSREGWLDDSVQARDLPSFVISEHLGLDCPSGVSGHTLTHSLTAVAENRAIFREAIINSLTIFQNSHKGEVLREEVMMRLDEF